MDELKLELDKINVPFCYSHFQKPVGFPYMVYIGSGQSTMSGDNAWYWKKNRYQLEYYYKLKDESKESAIEDILQKLGYNYTKSEDVYIENENVFLIYYTI